MNVGTCSPAGSYCPPKYIQWSLLTSISQLPSSGKKCEMFHRAKVHSLSLEARRRSKYILSLVGSGLGLCSS